MVRHAQFCRVPHPTSWKSQKGTKMLAKWAFKLSRGLSNVLMSRISSFLYIFFVPFDWNRFWLLTWYKSVKPLENYGIKRKRKSSASSSSTPRQVKCNDFDRQKKNVKRNGNRFHCDTRLLRHTNDINSHKSQNDPRQSLSPLSLVRSSIIFHWKQKRRRKKVRTKRI